MMIAGLLLMILMNQARGVGLAAGAAVFGALSLWPNC
jgi:hypothetical protein